MSISNAEGPEKKLESLTSEAQARRDFLTKAGRFAVVTPPSITLLLGTSLSSDAIAKSSGSHRGHGWGKKKHHHHGPTKRLARLLLRGKHKG
ncbi:hypothetical protein [Ensifer sp. BR816]|uniref:hypothetical protein n=1 Tax=Rhizobium sp. (strain BR816) TaxID=1057002 RepID=UPI000A00B457|nr:hypothetical protein [Ensifer sp. BR816]